LLLKLGLQNKKAFSILAFLFCFVRIANGSM